MKLAAKLSEAAFQRQVIELAKLRGWRVAHFRRVRVQRSDGSVHYETPVAADGKGFLDLLLLRGANKIVIELKVGNNVPTDEQIEWLDAWRIAGVAGYVFYPEDWDKIEKVLA